MSLIVELVDTKEDLKKLYTNNLEKLNSGSADFVNEMRTKAFEDFSRLGIPTTKNEDYRYTKLEPSFQKEYQYHFDAKKVKIDTDELFKCDIPDLNTDVEVLVNGWYFDQEKPLHELENGIIIGSFAEAAKKYPELVKAHYAKYAKTENDGLVALNTAFSQDGIFLYVPKNTVLEKPIQIINMLLDDENLMVQHRNLFILEDNSQAKVLVCDHTLCDRHFLTNSVTEIYAGNNAHFDLTKMQNEHNDATQLSGIFVHQTRDSHVSTNTISLHGGMIRNNFEIKLAEPGCQNETFGLYFTDRKQHISNHTLIEHAVPNCWSSQKFKGVLDDEATGAFNGKILVQEDAQKTEAYQTNNNILLTDAATMNSKPMLEIYADDVKCSHGATVGQLDDNALFYLQQRGIGQKEARLLLMYAFADEIISAMKVEALKERVENLVDKRLRGELSRCNNCSMQCS